MNRRALLVLLTFASAVVAACGRQVTPNPPGIGGGGTTPGYMSVKFDVSAPFDPSSFQYWVVFNTSGNGLTPDTMPFNSNWQAYSGALEVSGNAASISAHGIQFLKNPNPHIQPQFQPLITTPTQLQFVSNSNGTGTEFTILFQPQIFTPINATPSPGPSTSPLPFSKQWRFNAFTTQANVNSNLIFVDSMGAGGPGNPQFVSPTLNIGQCFDNVIYSLASGLQIQPAAEIVSVEIANNPNAKIGTPC